MRGTASNGRSTAAVHGRAPLFAASTGIPLFWRVETAPDLLLVAHRLVDGRYEQVCTVAADADVPVPWGTARVDLASLAR